MIDDILPVRLPDQTGTIPRKRFVSPDIFDIAQFGQIFQDIRPVSVFEMDMIHQALHLSVFTDDCINPLMFDALCLCSARGQSHHARRQKRKNTLVHRLFILSSITAGRHGAYRLWSAQ